MVAGLHKALAEWGSFHVESGTNVAALLAGPPFPGHRDDTEGTVVINLGDDVGRVMNATRGNSVSALVALISEPIEASPPVVAVGLHGFSAHSTPDGSFPLSLVDDWGIDDVMAAAFDSIPGEISKIALLVDLAVLDPAFEPRSKRTRPGGLDTRRLGRAAYVAGRHQRVSRVGLVASAPDAPVANLAHVTLSFCAGLAAR
jgi:hypothetical protein